MNRGPLLPSHMLGNWKALYCEVAGKLLTESCTVKLQIKSISIEPLQVLMDHLGARMSFGTSRQQRQGS